MVSILILLQPTGSLPGGTCSNIYKLGTCHYCIPDIKIICYGIESQSGKASAIVTVVVQCDGSQGDSCGKYEQQLPITASRPPVILTATVPFLSKVGSSQFELCPITMDKVFLMVKTRWIPPTVGTGTLRSNDRVNMMGIF